MNNADFKKALFVGPIPVNSASFVSLQGIFVSYGIERNHVRINKGEKVIFISIFKYNDSLYERLMRWSLTEKIAIISIFSLRDYVQLHCGSYISDELLDAQDTQALKDFLIDKESNTYWTSYGLPVWKNLLARIMIEDYPEYSIVGANGDSSYLSLYYSTNITNLWLQVKVHRANTTSVPQVYLMFCV